MTLRLDWRRIVGNLGWVSAVNHRRKFSWGSSELSSCGNKVGTIASNQYSTKRCHLAGRVYFYNPRMTSKRGKNKKVRTLRAAGECARTEKGNRFVLYVDFFFNFIDSWRHSDIYTLIENSSNQSIRCELYTVHCINSYGLVKTPAWTTLTSDSLYISLREITTAAWSEARHSFYKVLTGPVFNLKSPVLSGSSSLLLRVILRDFGRHT